mgnify:CR=1 FL=1
MKKTFLSVAILAIAVLCMTSCENKEKCWQAKITETYTYVYDEDENEPETNEREYWVWGTEEEVDAAIAAYKNSMEEYYKAREEFCKKYGFDPKGEFTVRLSGFRPLFGSVSVPRLFPPEGTGLRCNSGPGRGYHPAHPI